MKRTNYRTKQREQIIAAIDNFGNEHFTAADAVARLHDMNTPVAQSTVYRALEHLCEEGVLNRYEKGGQGGACYQRADGGCASHFHLVCSECGGLIHMDCEFMQSLAEHIKEHHGFDVDPSRTVLYGRCEKCEKKV